MVLDRCNVKVGQSLSADKNASKSGVDNKPDIDFVPHSVGEVFKAAKISKHILILNGINALCIFVFVKIFGRLAYKREYLQGKYFQHFWSLGWRWAFNGMFAKLFTGAGRGIPWPVSSQGSFGRNIDFHIDDLNNFQGPVHFQTFGNARIKLGKGVWIARGCALITTNHNLINPDIHNEPKGIEIDDHCWLGTNAVVMPGVTLGPHTVVGANAVVTKSFPNGYCVLGGVPAVKIKDLPRE